MKAAGAGAAGTNHRPMARQVAKPSREATEVTTRLVVSNVIDSNTVITVLSSQLVHGSWEPGCAPKPQSDIPWMGDVEWRARGALPDGVLGSVELAIVVIDPRPSPFAFEATTFERRASFDGHKAIAGKPWRGSWNQQKVTLTVIPGGDGLVADLVIGNLQP